MSKLITRTFENTVCTLMGVSIDKDGTPVILTETYTITDKVDKATAQKFVDKYYTGKIEHPAVRTIAVVSELVGVRPEWFYANGIKLDPETRKPIDTTITDVEAE